MTTWKGLLLIKKIHYKLDCTFDHNLSIYCLTLFLHSLSLLWGPVCGIIIKIWVWALFKYELLIMSWLIGVLLLFGITLFSVMFTLPHVCLCCLYENFLPASGTALLVLSSRSWVILLLALLITYQNYNFGVKHWQSEITAQRLFWL